MTESIGNLYPTAIPALSDPADIQEALRVYHYGAPSGSGTGQYPPSNSSPSNLVSSSIAYHLYNLQEQITNFEAGILPSAWTEKGVLISASQAGTPRPLSPAANGQVLVTNSATATGLEWQVPQVTLVNTVTLSNKTLLNSFISSDGIKFNGPVGNTFTTTFIAPTPTTNKVVSLPEASAYSILGTILPGTTLVGTDTAQTLTNKVIGVNQLDGAVPITKGGTGAITAAVARSNLEVFNVQTAVTGGNDRQPFSGKIYIADPAIVGATGANLDGASAGDLWFW